MSWRHQDIVKEPAAMSQRICHCVQHQRREAVSQAVYPLFIPGRVFLIPDTLVT